MTDQQRLGAGAAANRGRRVATWAAALVLVVLVGGVFGRTVTHGWAGYDEQRQVLRNPLAHSLAPANLVRICTARSLTSYYPVRLLSFAIDWTLWGNSPAGFHLTNLAIHAGSVLLLFALLRRLLGDLAGREGPWGVVVAALAAALFAVHPVVVEPVAWTGAREELLVVLGTLLALHAHATARARWRAGRRRAAVAYHVAAAGGCAVACFSGVAGVASAPILLVLDLVRVRRPTGRALVAGLAAPAALAGAAVILKLTEPQTVEGAHLVAAVGPGAHPRLVLDVYARNWATLLRPRDLAVIYRPVIPKAWTEPAVLAGLAAAVATVAALALAWRRKWRMTTLGLAWFVLALAPTSQLVLHRVFRTDRALYLPLAGLVVALAGASGRARRAWLRWGAAGVLAVAVGACAVGSVRQTSVWRDGVALFSRVVARDPANKSALNNLAIALERKGRSDEAIKLYRRALAIVPGDPELLENLGDALVVEDRLPEAADAYRRALAADENNARRWHKSATVLAALDRHDEALAACREALRRDPDRAATYQVLGNLRAKGGRPGEAVAAYREALRRDPDAPGVHARLGDAWARLGRHEEAVAHYRAALETEERDARTWYNLGVSLEALGRTDEAARVYAEAARLDPDHADVWYNLGNLLMHRARLPAAAGAYGRTLEADPSHARAHFNLAVVLGRLGRVAEAARHATRAADLAEADSDAALAARARDLAERLEAHEAPENAEGAERP